MCTGVQTVGGECLEFLKNNSIDYLFNPLDFRIISALNDTAFPLQEMVQDTTYLLTPYNCSLESSQENKRAKDFAEAAFAFQPETLFASISTLFLLMILTHTFQRWNEKVHPVEFKFTTVGKMKDNRFRYLPPGPGKIRGHLRKKDSGFWSIFRYVVNQPFLKSNISSARTLIFSLLLFQFFVIETTFKDSIESEKLTIYTPKVYRTFEDINHDDDVRFMYRETNPVKEVFKSAPDGTVFQSLYQKANDKGIGGGVTFGDMLSNMTCKPVRNVVAIGSALEVTNWRQVMCLIIAEKGGCYYKAFDPDHDMSSVHGQVASKSFSQSSIFLGYQKMMRRVFETGILTHGVFHRVSAFGTVTPAIADCVSDSRHPVTHLPQVEPFGLGNFKISFSLITFPFIFAAVEFLRTKLKDLF